MRTALHEAGKCFSQAPRTSTSFPKLRTYRSEREIEFVAPAMDDRVAIEITDEFDDALLQFVCRVDTDVAEH